MSQLHSMAQWDRRAEREDTREARYPAYRVYLDLVWEEIECRLPGVRTVLDVGGGTGHFSLPLARRGFELVHVDLWREMLRLARAKARQEGLMNIRFVQGSGAHLGFLKDGVFDLVLALDAPVSFAYPAHREVLSHLLRLSRRWVVVSVVNRLGGRRPGSSGTCG